MARLNCLMPLAAMASIACTESEPSNPYPRGDYRVAGDPGSGDTSVGDPSGGDTHPGDTHPGDTLTGDRQPGDANPGDTPGGDPTPGDPSTSCPEPGNTSGADVIGTRLEGLAVQWPGPIELCNLWQEGNTLEQEKARKMRVVLPRQFRPSLATIETQQVGIEGALFEKSPFHADRTRVAGCVTPTLRDHSIDDNATYTRWVHELEYDFGEAGKLIESYTVNRNAGDERPVVVDGTTWDEVMFSWESAAGDAWAMLAACTGGSSGEFDAVSVINGFDGGRSVTVIRYWRTELSMAGSFPVYIQAHQAVFSDRPWLVYEAEGFWTQTYSAQHHNWNEDSEVDFTRDLRWYHYLFKPGASGAIGGTDLARLDLRDLAGWDGTPSIDATFRTLDTGAETTTVYSVGTEWDEVNWQSVDDYSLMMGLEAVCNDGEILTLGSAVEGYWLRFLTCPRAAAPGFDLDTLVPVVFQHDAHHAGKEFTDAAVSPTTVGGAAGFLVDLGNATVRIWEQSASRLGVDVRDADNLELYSNLFTTRQAARDATLPAPEPWDEELRASNDSGVSMVLVRRTVGLGGGLTTIYAPVRFELTFDGATHIADSMDMLDYTWVHHNDSDSLVASDGALNLFWQQGWDATLGTIDLVRAESLTGSVVLPETTLTRD